MSANVIDFYISLIFRVNLSSQSFEEGQTILNENLPRVTKSWFCTLIEGEKSHEKLTDPSFVQLILWDPYCKGQDAHNTENTAIVIDRWCW